MAVRRRPCLGCGRLAAASRCDACSAVRSRIRERARTITRATTAQRGYGSAWRAIAAAVLRRDGARCHWCGSPATSVDHVVPKCRGGSDRASNLVAACILCNSARGGRG